jgi:hypothetical protein
VSIIDQTKAMMARLQVGLGRTFLMENVLQYDMGVQVAHDWHDYQRRHTTETKSLHIQFSISRKMPSATTLFMDSALHCDRTGRKLCKICMHWGWVDDPTEKCKRCSFYLIPNDKAEADMFISKLKCEEAQWDYNTTPFDELSQIGGTLTYTTKLTPSQAFRGNNSLLVNQKSDMDMPRFRLNQVRAYFAANLGKNPIFSGRLCERIRGLLEPRENKDRHFITFMEAVQDGHEVLFDRKTILITSNFSLVESDLKMTFRLYLPANPLHLDGRPVKIGVNEGSWAADRVILSTFLCADPSSSLHCLRSETHFTKPAPVVVVPVKAAKAVKGAKAAKAIPAGLKEIMSYRSETSSGSGSGTGFGSESMKVKNETEISEPTPSSPSSSVATSSATSSSSRTTGVGLGAGSPTQTPTSSSADSSFTTSSTTSSTASSSGTSSASEHTDTPANTSTDIADSDSHSEGISPLTVATSPSTSAPSFHRIKSSSGDNRVVDEYDALDVSLSGLFRSIMTDGMKMTTIFQGFEMEKTPGSANPSIMTLYSRHSDARNSIAGLMRVSTYVCEWMGGCVCVYILCSLVINST